MTDVKSVANPTEIQSLGFLKQRLALMKRIRTFRKLQRTYMPQLCHHLTAAQHVLLDLEAERLAEGV
jgi:hypothetical protein